MMTDIAMMTSIHRTAMERAMQTLLQDLRYFIRQAGQEPGLHAAAVISLALGIGATTAVFSVVYAVLIHPYPHLPRTVSWGSP